MSDMPDVPAPDASDASSSTSSVSGEAPAGLPRKPRDVGWRNSDVLRTAALVMAIYVGLRLAWFARPLLLTAFLGILFGLAVSAGVDQLTRFHLPRGVSAALIVLSFFGVLAGFGAWVAPTVHTQGIELRQRLPDAIDRLESWINGRHKGVLGMVFSGLSTEARADSAGTTRSGNPVTPSAGAMDTSQPVSGTAAPATTQPSQQRGDTTASEALRDRIGNQFSGVTRYLRAFLSSTIEVVAGIFIIIFLAIYIAVKPGMYRRGILLLLPAKDRAKAGEVLSAIATVLRKWLVTQLIAMVVIGVVTTVALLLLHVQAAFALGLLSGLFEFIPTVGPIFSSLPAIAMGFLDSPEKALWVTIAYIGVQFLENHLLLPLLMQGSIDLPPVLTILTQAVMALVFGLLGLMCAVPLLAATMVAVKMLYVQGDVPDTTVHPVRTRPAHAQT